MKIALLYSGQLRTLAETIATNLAYFKACGATHIDIYVCITNNVGYRNKLNDYRYVPGYRAVAKPFITIGDLDKIIEPYLNETVGKGTCVVKTIPFKLPNGETDIWESHQHFFNHNLITQYYLMQECINMVGHKRLSEYDMLVRMRTDVVLQNTINAQHLKGYICADQLIVDKHIYGNVESSTMVNDGFFMGSPQVMFTACNVYENFKFLQSQIEDYCDNEFTNTPGSIFYCNLVIEEFDTRIIKHDFNYRVLR